jgi:hypothetical protein
MIVSREEFTGFPEAAKLVGTGGTPVQMGAHLCGMGRLQFTIQKCSQILGTPFAIHS